MTEPTTAAHAIVVQQEMPHTPEKVWRALTESPLMSQWLMQNDFEPVVGRRFQFRAEPMPQWNGVTDCEVLIVEPHRKLSYSWNSSGDEAGDGLRTVVTWTLTPTKDGTLLRMDHTGFRPQDEGFQKGAGYGWKRMVATLEQVVAGLR